MHLIRRLSSVFLIASLICVSKASAAPEPRDFETLTEQNAQDIDYIITTLGTKNLVAIGFAKSKICKTGARANTVHPIRYLLFILSDKRLSNNLRGMRNNGWIWNGFLHGEHGDDGFVDSLTQEAEVGGILPRHLQMLAAQINVNYDRVKMLSDHGEWEALIELIMGQLSASAKVKKATYEDI